MEEIPNLEIIMSLFHEICWCGHWIRNTLNDPIKCHYHMARLTIKTSCPSCTTSCQYTFQRHWSQKINDNPTLQMENTSIIICIYIYILAWFASSYSYMARFAFKSFNRENGANTSPTTSPFRIPVMTMWASKKDLQNLHGQRIETPKVFFISRSFECQITENSNSLYQ